MTIEPGGVCGPGPAWPEDRYTSYWLENTGTTPAVEVSVDIGWQSQRRFAKHEAPSSSPRVFHPGGRSVDHRGDNRGVLEKGGRMG